MLNFLPLEKESKNKKKGKKVKSKKEKKKKNSKKNNRKCQRKAKKSRNESFPLASLGLPKNSISLSVINAKKQSDC